VRKSTFLVTLVLLGCLLTFARAQTQQPPVGYILGKVLDAQSSTPIAGAQVQIAAISGSQQMVETRMLTDAEGRFLFRSVPPGSYLILAGVGGANNFTPNGFIVSGSGFPVGSYLNGGYGQRRPAGPLQPLMIREGQRIGDVVIRLWKAGIITGRVTDEAGEPLIGQVVGAVEVSGDGRLLTGPTVRTDDRGAYRVSGLVPGSYIVFVPQTQVSMPLSIGDSLVAAGPDPLTAQKFSMAFAPSARVGGVRVGSSLLATTPDPIRFSADALISNAIAPLRQGDALFVYPTTFASSATRLGQAERTELKAGEERTAVDVRLQPTRAGSISGVLVDERGPVPHVGLHLMPDDIGRGGSVLEAATTASDGSGSFSFPAVPAGQYTILVWRTGGVPTDRKTPELDSRTGELSGAWARQSVSVGARPVENLTVRMRAPVTISGRAVFEGAAAPPSAERLRTSIITVIPAEPVFRAPGPAAGSPFDAASAFRFSIRGGSPPGRFLLRPPAMPSPWVLQSIAIHGRDITDVAFDIGSDDIDDVVVTYTNTPASLSVTVEMPTPGQSDVTAFIFPADRARWPEARLSTRMFKPYRVPVDGMITSPSMPPGDYLVIAIDDALAGRWPDESFLARLAPLATPVRIARGQRVAVAIKVSQFK
jgi:hypothetical protein